MKKCVSLLAVVLLTSAAAHAMLLPAGKTYVTPTGTNMTLAFAEDYGTDFDGAGSWTGTGVSVQSDYVQLDVASGSSPTLDIGALNLRTNESVVDIGIKSYMSDNWPGAWSTVLRLNSIYGSGMRNEWIFRPDGDLGSQNVPGATITGKVSPTGTPLKINEGQPSVLRLTGTAASAAAYLDDATDLTTTGYEWNGGSFNGIKLWSQSPGSAQWQVAWVRIYTNVDPASYGAPLVPEPATITMLALASLAMLRRK